MDRIVLTLIYSAVPLLVVAGVLIVYRRRVARPTTGFFALAAVLLGVVILSTVLAGSGISIPEPVLIVGEAAGGSIFAWYAFRSWQATGWSRATQRITLSVFGAVAVILITLMAR